MGQPQPGRVPLVRLGRSEVIVLYTPTAEEDAEQLPLIAFQLAEKHSYDEFDIAY